MKKYFDRNGIELKEGDMVKFPDGKIRKLYLTENDELGIDATNPMWLETGKAVECEYGIYPLDNYDCSIVEKV